MPLSVAEYLGQRTDSTHFDIIPSDFGGSIVPTCPFSGVACQKLKSSKPSPPVCSVRTTDGKPFIVCSDRLIPSKANALSSSHISALAAVSGVLFPKASTKEVGYKRQVSIPFSKGRKIVLDYVLQVNPQAGYKLGRDKVILEIQGGGETSSTGSITHHVAKWASLTHPDNQFLAQALDASYLRGLCKIKGGSTVNVPGIIPNNAWKRQLDQVLKKSVLARQFNAGFALVMGEILYDYVQVTLSVKGEYFPEWEIALLGIAETYSDSAESILYNKASKAVFLSYANFITALQDFSLPADIKTPFGGKFTTLRNSEFEVK